MTGSNDKDQLNRELLKTIYPSFAVNGLSDEQAQVAADAIRLAVETIYGNHANP